MAEPSAQPRSRIYVSYQARGEDELSSRLLENLRRRFGVDTILTSSDIREGSRQEITEQVDLALESCHSLIVVVGPEWLRDRSDGGEAPRPEEDDLTVCEVATGLLKEHLTTIAVLLHDRPMPLVSDLPKALAALAERPNLVLVSDDWDDGISRLAEALERSSRICELIARSRATGLTVPELDALRRELRELLAPQVRDEGDRQPAPAATVNTVESSARGAVVMDENVQFTVFRRTCIQPQRWYPLLAFAHLSERRADASPDEPDPVAEVRAQAARVLGTELSEFRAMTEDSGSAVMREGELRFVPSMDGIEFNPRERRFFWSETVHREDFRMRADRSMDGRVARGTLTVYAGNLVLADVRLSVKVDRSVADAPQERSEARPYRRIFASYSHRDTPIVEEFESHAAALGDRYLRDVISLRSGEVWNDRLRELIEQADVFQLFWSWNALTSPMVRAEWQHALALNRPYFVRPVYWEDPLPEQHGLPPSELRRLHFQKVYPGKPPLTPAPSIPIQVPPSRAPKRAHDTGVIVPIPHGPTAHGVPKRSNLRLVRYAAMVAVCVIAASVLVAVRPFLSTSSVPTVGEESPAASPAAPPPTLPVPEDHTASPSPPAVPSTSPVSPPPAPPRPVGTPSPASNRSATRVALERVLHDYEGGWARKDRDALMRVWLMPPQAAETIDAEFRRARDIDVRVRIVAVEFPTDRRAIVTADEMRSVTTTTSGTPHRTQERRVFHLEKRGGEWIIVAILG